MVNNDDASVAFALGVEIGENAEEEVEEELEGAHTICLHCGDGGSEEELMLCDGMDCDNVSFRLLCVCVCVVDMCFSFVGRKGGDSRCIFFLL